MTSPITPMRLLIIVIVTFAVGALISNLSEPVQAHGNQIDSSPPADSEIEDSPDRVIVWFSEPIEETFSEVTVLNSAGEQVDLGNSEREPSEPSAISVGLPLLDDGTYTVVWKNLSSVDGHKVIGSYVFAIGEPLSSGVQIATEKQPLLQTIADPWLRWLVYLGAAIVFGGLVFEMTVGIPAIYGRNAENRWEIAVSLASSRWSKLAFIGLAIVGIGMIGQLLQQASVLTEKSIFAPDFGTLQTVALESGWGRLWTYRFITAIAAGFMLLLAKSQAVTPETEVSDEDDSDVNLIGDSVAAQVTVILGLVFMGLLAASGHNAATPTDVKTFAIVTDFVHLVASTVWLGGVFYLAISVPMLLRILGTASASRLFKVAVSRFTVLGILSAGTLVTTGIFSSYMQVTIPAATNTPYGWFLVGKIALIVPLFLVAGFNGFRLARKFGSGGETTFRRSIVVELIIAVLILGAVGWLASLEPARQYAGRTGIAAQDEASFAAESEGTVFDISITPATVGKNDVRVRIQQPDGEPIDNAIDVRVRIKFIDDDLAEPLVSLEDTGAGFWVLNDSSINIAGNYQAEVVVLRPDAFDSRTAFRFKAQSAAASADAIKPDADTANRLFSLELVIIGGLILVVGFRGKFPGTMFKNVNVRWEWLAPGTTLAVFGALLFLNAQVTRIGLTDDIRNPFPPTADSVSLGEPVYANSCAACHGVGGLGDGPAGVGLPKKPADLFIHVPLHSDTILYEFIRDGIESVGMPGHEDALAQEEMWHLVNYLRSRFDAE